MFVYFCLYSVEDFFSSHFIAYVKNAHAYCELRSSRSKSSLQIAAYSRLRFYHRFQINRRGATFYFKSCFKSLLESLSDLFTFSALFSFHLNIIQSFSDALKIPFLFCLCLPIDWLNIDKTQIDWSVSTSTKCIVFVYWKWKRQTEKSRFIFVHVWDGLKG